MWNAVVRCSSQAEVAECSNSNKRLSKDSGTGSDIEQDSLRGMYSRKSSHGRNSDSGVCGVYVCVCVKCDQSGEFHFKNRYKEMIMV